MQLLNHLSPPKTLAGSRRRLPVRCRYSSPAAPGAQQLSRLFVGYSIYKGKAALTVDPIAPEFARVDSGGYRVSKEGMVMLKFVPAIATRQYDWNRKQFFSLSVAEVATLVSLGAMDSCEFFHDPFMGKSEEGMVRKVLKAEPLPDASGHFFNLRVENRMTNVDENMYIPISRPEFTVLNSSFKFIIPYLLGWHAFANSISPEESFRSKQAKPDVELEWSS